MFEEKFQGYIEDKIQLFYMKKFQYRENRPIVFVTVKQ